jgi:P27 family predicted phage terminase small subunit
MSGRGGARIGAGRKPKPTRLKEITGNFGGKPLNVAEPRPPLLKSMPNPPHHFDRVAIREWNTMGPVLGNLGLLTEIDITAFAIYCDAFSRWVQSSTMLRKGLIVVSKNGVQTPSPFLSIQARAIEQMSRFLTEFGMTPAARSKIRVDISTSLPEPTETRERLQFLTEKYLG